MFFSVLFYCIRRGGKGFTEVRFVLQFGTFCFEPLEHFVLRIISAMDCCILKGKRLPRKTEAAPIGKEDCPWFIDGFRRYSFGFLHRLANNFANLQQGICHRMPCQSVRVQRG